MEFTSEEGEQKYAAARPGGRRDDRRAGLRRHPGPDRRGPGRGAHPPRGRRGARRPGRAGARDRGGHRPPGPTGARPRWARAGRQRDRRRRQGALPVRPVRQRALELHQPPGDRAAAAARAGHVHRRPAAAAAPARRSRTRTSRRRGWPSRCTPAGWTDPDAAYDELLPGASASRPTATTWSSSPASR